MRYNRSVKYKTVPIETLVEHPKNPRQGDVGAIVTSIEENGVYRPLVVQESTNHVLAGNHSLKAMRALGHKKVSIVALDVDDATALRIMLVDNRSAELATYDDPALAAILEELAREGALLGTGYDGDDVDQLLRDIAAADQPGEPRGASLDVLNVSIAEPTHVVESGESWSVGPHALVVVDVHTGWPEYIALLVPGVVFAPYPTPMLAVVSEAPLVMVQPDEYLAGHVLDKYASCHGAESVAKL